MLQIKYKRDRPKRTGLFRICKLFFLPLFPIFNICIPSYALAIPILSGKGFPYPTAFPTRPCSHCVRPGIPFVHPRSLARTGWTTDELAAAIARMQRLLPRYDLVTLMIGVNNQYRGRDPAGICRRVRTTVVAGYPVDQSTLTCFYTFYTGLERFALRSFPFS